MICMSCGGQNATASRYCSNCGKALQDVSGESTHNSEALSAPLPPQAIVRSAPDSKVPREDTSPSCIMVFVALAVGIIYLAGTYTYFIPDDFLYIGVHPSPELTIAWWVILIGIALAEIAKSIIRWIARTAEEEAIKARRRGQDTRVKE